VIRIERGIGVDCEDPLIVRNPPINIPPAFMLPLATDRPILDDGTNPAAKTRRVVSGWVALRVLSSRLSLSRLRVRNSASRGGL